MKLARDLLWAAAASASAWAVVGLWSLVLARPRDVDLLPAALGATTLAALAGWALVRQGRLRSASASWPLAVTATHLCLVLRLQPFLWPAMWGILLIPLIAVPAVVVAVAAVARLRRRWWDSLAALTLLLAVITAVPTTVATERAGWHFRIGLVATSWERKAADVARAPARRPHGTTPFRADGPGGTVVAWKLVDGIPARSYGAVYDPRRALAGGVTAADTGYAWSVDRCWRIRDRWWWCRVY